jgi:hypothetical protein
MNKIYLIQSTDDSCYKIGVSKHPQKRLAEHQTGNPSPLKLIDTYPSDIAYEIEKVLHRKYSYAKKEGEWFDLGVLNEVTFKSECQKIEENLKFLKKNGNVFI